MKTPGQYVVGVTGEIGVGKSYVCEKFVQIGKERGILVNNIDFDQIVHRMYDGRLKEPLYEDVRKKIVEAFGKNVVFQDGMINRKVLGEIVFSDQKEMEKLNRVVHEPMMVELRKELRGKKGLILINSALFAELGMNSISNNNTILVVANKEIQERRLKDREFDKDQIHRRLESQYNADIKRKTIEDIISRDKKGQLWIVDNSDDSNENEITSLFDKIVRYMNAFKF